MGVDSDQDLHARAPPFRSDLCHHRRARRTFRLRAVHTPLLSHSARSGTGGTQAENKPARLAGDRKFASDPYNRYPRSLAALETTKLLTRVKQVGSSQLPSNTKQEQKSLNWVMLRVA